MDCKYASSGSRHRNDMNRRSFFKTIGWLSLGVGALTSGGLLVGTEGGRDFLESLFPVEDNLEKGEFGRRYKLEWEPDIVNKGYHLSLDARRIRNDYLRTKKELGEDADKPEHNYMSWYARILNKNRKAYDDFDPNPKVGQEIMIPKIVPRNQID